MHAIEILVAFAAFAAVEAWAVDPTSCKNHYILDAPCETDNSASPINQIYSNLDGSIQYIEIDTTGPERRIVLAGRTLTSRYGGVVKAFTFPEIDSTPSRVVVAAVPEWSYQHRLWSTATTSTSRNAVSFGPHYYLPARFFSTDGGVIELDGIPIFSYMRLPTDGYMALYRDGRIAKGRLSALFTPEPQPVLAVEYYRAGQDHYFVSASAPDIDALDSGRIGGWVRTGKIFGVGVARYNSLGIEYSYFGIPVCRIYIPPEDGDSHFFSASPEECTETLRRHPMWVLESAAAFYAAVPDPVTGECGVMPGFVDGDIPLSPVYRLWNRRSDTNHRYTMDPDIRDEMIARGWVPEGYGPIGVVFCTS